MRLEEKGLESISSPRHTANTTISNLCQSSRKFKNNLYDSLTLKKLSKVIHTPHLEYRVLFASHGLRVSKSMRKSAFTVPNKREIVMFSSSSRRNLIFKINTLNFDYISRSGLNMYFVTLTYQTDFFFNFKDLKAVKDDLKVFVLYLQRYYSSSNITFIWKLEFTKKRVPHFHLFLITDLSKSDLIYGVSRFWSEAITRNIDVDIFEKLKFARVGTQVKSVYTSSRVFSYLTKYISKDSYADYGWVGRFWGIYNRAFFRSLTYTFTLFFHSYDHYFRFKRACKKYLLSRYKKMYEYKKQFDPSLSFKKRRFFVSGLSVLFVPDISVFIRLFFDTL